MTESGGEAVKAVVRWYSLETGIPIYSKPMSYRDALSTYHQSEADQWWSKPSVCKQGTVDYRRALLFHAGLIKHKNADLP